MYMEDLEHGYLWTDCVTREDLTEVPGHKFTRLIQVTIN